MKSLPELGDLISAGDVNLMPHATAGWLANSVWEPINWNIKRPQVEQVQAWMRSVSEPDESVS